jgi:outer membrane protein assembly factor BamD (BamD/ComL family)
MAKTKVSRKELLTTNDEFIHFSSRAIIFISEHSHQFIIAGYCLLAVIFIYIGIYFYLKSENNKAHDIYNIAYSKLSTNMKPDMDKEDLAISKENFTRLIEEYGISDVSRLALPELAYIDFLEKNYDSAIARYQDFLSKTPEEPYQSLAMIALSICYEEQGEYENAIISLQKILSGPDDFFKEQAMLSLARVYRLQNNFEKSNEVLGEFIEKFPASTSLSLAKANIKP